MRFAPARPSPQYDAQNEGNFRRDVEQAFGQAASSASVNVLKSYVKTDLPDPVPVPGMMIFVSNDVGGSTPAFSDGTSWRRTSDRAVIA
jgi:hypothetical protein